MEVFHSLAAAAVVWVAVAGGFYALARAIYGNIESRREAELRQLADRLEQVAGESRRLNPPPPTV
jgi:hypothetical protein